MFAGTDSREQIKAASSTQLEGFPADAALVTVHKVVSELKQAQ
jgi:hypothetical protein